MENFMQNMTEEKTANEILCLSIKTQWCVGIGKVGSFTSSIHRRLPKEWVCHCLLSAVWVNNKQ